MLVVAGGTVRGTAHGRILSRSVDVGMGKRYISARCEFFFSFFFFFFFLRFLGKGVRCGKKIEHEGVEKICERGLEQYSFGGMDDAPAWRRDHVGNTYM